MSCYWSKYLEVVMVNHLVSYEMTIPFVIWKKFLIYLLNSDDVWPICGRTINLSGYWNSFAWQVDKYPLLEYIAMIGQFDKPLFQYKLQYPLQYCLDWNSFPLIYSTEFIKSIALFAIVNGSSVEFILQFIISLLPSISFTVSLFSVSERNPKYNLLITFCPSPISILLIINRTWP